jgi:WD40 repeat protein
MIRLWDPATFRETGAVRARPPAYHIACLALSPDGKRLAVVDWPAVAFYDLSGAEPVREKAVLESGGEGCSRIAFLPDGKRLIGSGNGGGLYLWDLASGQTKPAWKRTIWRTGYHSNPTPFALSEDGRTFACFSDAKTATLLDVSGAGPREILAMPLPAPALALALSPDAKRLAVGFQDRKIRFWGVSGKAPEPEGEIDFGPDPGVLRFSPDGKRLAGAYTQIRLWDFERNTWIAETPNIHGACMDFSFALDGQALIAACGGGAIHFWGLSGEKLEERSPVKPSTYLTAPANWYAGFSPDGKRLATGDLAGFGWWDLDRASPARLREMAGRLPFAVSPDGKQMLRGWGLAWCDLTNDQLRESEEFGQVQDASRFRLLPDGKTILVGTTKGEFLFVERGAERKLVERSRFRVGDGQVNALEVSPDGRMVATYTESGHAVKLWDRTGDKLALRDALQEGRPIYHIVFSPDGWLFAVADTSDITVWDVQSRPAQQRRRWNEGWDILSVAFSPDGRTLATASNQGKLALRDIKTGETRREWQLPGQINFVTYAPDGRHLLTINSNGTGYILRLAPSPSARVDDAWLKRVAAMPTKEQLEAVAAKLKELNPGFDGTVKPTMEDGAVTHLEVFADDWTDISPLRSLTKLRGLALLGHEGKCRLADLSPLKGMPLTSLDIRNTQVSDLSPLKGMPLKTLDCDFKPERDTEILRAIPTLETINGKPAKDFWKEVDAKREQKR